MASFNYDSDTRKAFMQFRDSSRQRRGIRLSGVSKLFAQRFHATVEKLHTAKETSGSIDNHTADFVRSLGDVYFDKLVKVGLVEPRQTELPEPTSPINEEKPCVALGEFLTEYLQKRNDVKQSTLLVYRQIESNLNDYFEPGKPLDQITEGDVVDFGRWMHGRNYSRTTIDRRLSLCRTIFADVVRHRLLAVNPFDGFRKPLRGLVSRNNRKRIQIVSSEDILQVIEFAPDAEWRCLIALSRFGGLRVPSEALSLRWTDIDWHQGTIRVPCPKLEHLEGHEDRVIPIFSELRPFLQECFDTADPGSEFVITRNRPPVLKSGAGWANANLRTRFEKIIKRAGLKPWPRLWHNLRASRQTELSDQFPAHVVCQWIGNSEIVAREHYLSVTPEHMQRAIEGVSLPGVMPSVMPHDVDLPSIQPQSQIRPAEEDSRNSSQRKRKRPHAEACDRSKMEDNGLEPMTFWLPARRSPN
jgi:site-specific recombinase XerD